MLCYVRSRKRGKREEPRNIKKKDIPRINRISSLVEGTAGDWIRYFLYKVMALWVGVIVSPK